ncbi:phage baseplate protein [Cupriavidus basilensis]
MLSAAEKGVVHTGKFGGGKVSVDQEDDHQCVRGERCRCHGPCRRRRARACERQHRAQHAGSYFVIGGFDMILLSSKKIGDIEISATVEETYEDELQITEHPVEKGAQVTDHAFKRRIWGGNQVRLE